MFVGYDHAMSEPNSERVITPMPKSLLQRIDDFRFANRIASRAEAMRLLIERGLAAEPGAGGAVTNEEAPRIRRL